MKLLTKKETKTSLVKQNEELIDSNIRLQRIYKDTKNALDRLKDNYEPDKVQKAKEFENFCRDLFAKRSKLLEEMTVIQTEIDKKKEVYYGFVGKQDVMDQRLYELNEREKKLDIRENFIKELEKKHGLT